MCIEYPSRAVTDKDAESLYSIYSDAEVMRYWGASPMKDPQEAKDFLAEVLKDLRGRQCIQWGIARRTDSRIIGTVALFHFDFFSRKAEIGFALGVLTGEWATCKKPYRPLLVMLLMK
jgi:ribosomal-protein-alanine N-acetyltransferase